MQSEIGRQMDIQIIWQL